MEHALSLGDQRWDLSDGSDSITIGRASNADIRLTADDQISRIHARLARSGSTWTLIDESRNGTALNGRRLAAPTPLTDNDQIQIGRSALTFHETPSQAAAQPAEAPPASFTPPAEAPPASFSPPEPPPAAAYPPPAEAPYPADDAYPAPANDQYAGPADEQYAASSDQRDAPSNEQYRAPAEDAFSGQADGAYAAPDEASYREEDASAYHRDSGEAPAAAPSGPAERPQVVDRFSLAEPVALGDPAAYAPVTPPSSRADRGENRFAPTEAEPGPSPYAPTAHNQQPSPPAPPEPNQNARPFNPPDPADRGPSLADRGPSPVTPANRNQQPSTVTPDPGPDPSAYKPAEADRGKNPFAPPESEQAASPFAPAEGNPSGIARAEGEPSGFAPAEGNPSGIARAEGEPGGFAPREGGQGASPFAPTEPEPGGFTPPDSAQSGSPFAEGEPGRFASPEGAQGGSPFAAAEGEPGRFASPEGAQGGSPFAAAEGEPGGFTPPESAQGGSPFAEGEPGGFAPGEGEHGGNPFAPGEAEQGVSQFARADGEYEPSGGERVDEGLGGVAVGPGDWGAYPSADNPEPARSPWAGGMTVPVQFDRSQASRNESASWPDTGRAEEQAGVAPPAGGAQTSRGAAGARQTSRTAQASRTTDARAAQAKTRRPADPDEVGQVRLGRVLAVAGALLALGLLINLVVTFFSSGPGDPLRWLVPPVIALITAMVVALMDALSGQERSPGRFNVSVIVAIVVVLLGVGVGGFALTAAAQYAAGYFTGKESGEARLVKPVGKAFDGLTVTVENVTYTSHFTRVQLAVKNAGDQSVALPLDGNVALTGPEGNAIRADDSRSQWPGKFPSGGTEHGTITFTGHLPDNLTTATLTLKSGDAPVAVGIALSN
ncbi:FHA domain-containing protein [Kribbella sp. NBC_00889]|uniref:FHA domain-containing protein n=1 Tax=Kribbella sp. NBC_00889 TaxID=2975974 RepID=UPI0038658D90|nr:FHA domain-containing protein [Kribbella sp. NBC_00889]